MGETCGVLQAQVVEFHHHAVGGVGQLPAAFIPLGKEGFDGGQALAQLGVGVHLEPCRLEPLQRFPLAGRPAGSGGEVQGVGEEIQAPGGHHLGVELAQGARAGVAGVGKRGLSPGGPLGVDGRKGGVGNEGLTAHLHPLRGVVELEPQRHRPNRAHVGGDLLPPFPIAAGGGPHQQPVFIAQG